MRSFFGVMGEDRSDSLNVLLQPIAYFGCKLFRACVLYGRLVAFWLSVVSAVVLSLVLRVPNEEEILKEKFGEEWTEWAEKVRYRFVPGVY